MQELIKIEKKEGIETVSARDLHEYLESKRDFPTWIKTKIERYNFIENIDYIRFHKKGEANNATIIEYYISIDMAKDISMVENNKKGEEARTYFRNCEKQLKSIVQKIDNTKIDNLTERVNQLEKKINHKPLIAESFSKEMEIIKEDETGVILKWHGGDYVVIKTWGLYWNVCYYYGTGSSNPPIKMNLNSKYKALEWVKRNL